MRLRFLFIYSFALSLCSGALAQADPKAAHPNTPVKATLADVSWLIGDWEGQDSVGDRVIERWLPPIDGVMVGTFVQTKRDTEKKVSIDWSELSHLREQDGTLTLYTLTMQAGFELEEATTHRRPALSVKPCKLEFKELVMECSNPKQPGSGLTVTYGEDFMNDGTGVYIVRYKKAGGY